MKGIFHVYTKFFHINFLPLIPLSSYLFVHKLKRAVQIPLQDKSVALGYTRNIAAATSAGMLIWMIIALTDENTPMEIKLAATLSFVGTLCLAGVLMWHPRTRKASAMRAMELVELATSALDPSTTTPHAVQRFHDTLQAAVERAYPKAFAPIPQNIDGVMKDTDEMVQVTPPDVVCGGSNDTEATAVAEKEEIDTETTESSFDSEGVTAPDDIELGEVAPPQRSFQLT